MKRARIGYALWLIALGCLYFFENNAGTRAALAASLILPACGALIARHAARNSAPELIIQRAIVKGDAANVELRLNGSRFCALCAWECELTLRAPLAGAELSVSAEVYDGRACIAQPASYCGRLSARVTALRVSDMFGLWRFDCPGAAYCEAIVRPAERSISATPPEAEALTRAEAPYGAPAGAMREPGSDVREYAPGDSVRTIHWKLSSKLDQLLVREDAPAGGDDVLILLETALPASMPGDMDAAAEGALALSRALAAEGRAHCVGWLDYETGELYRRDVASPAEYRAMCDALLTAASAEGDSGIARAFAAMYPLDAPGSVFIFSARADCDATPFLADSRVTLALPAGALQFAAPEVDVVCLDDMRFSALGEA